MIDISGEFFDPDDFGEVVTLNGKKTNAIFTEKQVEQQNGMTVVVGYKPKLTVQTVDVIKSKVKVEDAAVIRKEEYEVSEIQVEGGGFSAIYLFKKIVKK